MSASIGGWIVAWIVVAAVIAALDGLWLGRLAKGFYRRHLRPILRPKPDVVAAGLFYVVYVTGVVFLAIEPATSGLGALARGAALGALCYATYDLTNRATIRPFPWTVVVADIAWGTSMTAVASWAGWMAAS